MNIIKRIPLILLLLIVIPLSAQDLQLSLPDTNGVRGEFSTIPVRVQPSLTGQSVTSYQLNIQFDDYVLAVDSVLIAGTMTGSAGMSYYYRLPQPNVIKIAAAGTNPLQGEGVLVYLRFRVRHSGYSALHFTGPRQNILNEGEPAVLLEDGSLNASEPATITIYPDQDVLAVGEQLQFFAYNATEPIQWQVTNSAVVSIDALGNLTALKTGKSRVVATDAVGLRDTTNGIIEIRPLKLSIQDTTITSGQLIELPIYSSVLTNLGIVAGTVTLTFDGNILKPKAVLSAGTVLESYANVKMNATISGKATIAFAGTSPLSGSGILCKVQFLATQPGWTQVEFAKALFNESLVAKTVNGVLQAQSAAALNIDPQAGTMIVGDSLQFSVVDGTPPFTWEVSNPLLASINSNGLLIASKSGIEHVVVRDAANASGISGSINIYNVKMSIGNIFTTAGRVIEVPVRIEQFQGGAAISAFQAIIDFDSSAIKAVAVLNSGTLSTGWSYVQSNQGNRLSVAAAGVTGLHETGTLFYIRFQVKSTLPVDYYSTITFSRLLLNEGDPSVLPCPGSILIVSPPSEPNLILPEDGAEDLPSSIQFSWSTSSQAEFYRLQIANNSDFSTIIFQDSLIAGTSRTVTGLGNGVYFWRVKASNAAGSSAWSSGRSFTVNSQVVVPPAVPQLISPKDGADYLPSDIRFSWYASSRAETYRLQIADNNLFTTIIFQDSLITDTSRQVTGIAEGQHYWRVSASNTGGTSDWSSVRSFSVSSHLGENTVSDLPTQFALMHNYPNPFNPTTIINYQLPKSAKVSLRVYDLSGREVATLVNTVQSAGYYSVIFNAANLPSGAYIYRLQAGNFVETKKLLLVR